MMNRFLMSAAVLALLSTPALAQSSYSSSTETTRTVATPIPVPVPVQTSTSSTSSTVTHSDDGAVRTDSKTEKYVAPDGSTSTSTKVIQQQNQ